MNSKTTMLTEVDVTTLGYIFHLLLSLKKINKELLTSLNALYRFLMLLYKIKCIIQSFLIALN